MRQPNNPKVTVIGAGYLGATHAVCMADLGYDVLALDVDAGKVARLAAGETPFFEPGLEPLLRKQLELGRLRFTTSYDDVAAFGDVHFLCVGTPQQAGGKAADLSYLRSAVDQLAGRLRRPCLVVGKSTVPAGTAAALAERIAELAPAGVELAWNPEFLREGFAVEDSLHPDRLVVGVNSAWSLGMLRSVYRPVIDAGTPLLVMDPATAELVKVAANAFLATKISFINAMSEICDITGADVSRLSEALGHDSRIGRRFLTAGLGFGGGCLPKDIRAFQARAEELGATESLRLLHEVDAINLRCRERTIAAARDAVGGRLAGRRVAVLGCAFKPNSDDIRDSPALDVAARLAAEGAQVCVHDPVATGNAAGKHPELEYTTSISDALAGADVVLHLTEWDDYRAIDPVRAAESVTRPWLVDARNALDSEAWRAAGWTVRQLGRP